MANVFRDAHGPISTDYLEKDKTILGLYKKYGHNKFAHFWKSASKDNAKAIKSMNGINKCSKSWFFIRYFKWGIGAKKTSNCSQNLKDG